MQPTWQILPDPLTSDLYTPQVVAISAATGRSIKTGFSGRGILRPFRRNSNGDFDNADGERLVRAGVGLILSTMCSSGETHGELPWRTEFGSLLALPRLRNNNAALKELAKFYVVDAIAKWLPSVRIVAVTLSQAEETMYLKVTYDIVDPPSARVLVPGIQTAVQLG